MVFEPVVIVNGLSQLSAAAVSLFLALKLRKEKECLLQKPFYLLSAAFFAISLLNMLWFFGLVNVSEWDNLFIGPIFNLAFLAVWFYTGLLISGNRHIYYFIPLFIMSINALLLFKNLAVVCDVITGLVLIGIFFHLGFANHHFIKKMSYVGMGYGFLIPAVAVFSHIKEIPYLNSFWFIPTAAVFYLLFLMWKQGHVCISMHEPEKHHIPVIVEVFRLGSFVVGLSILLMLGTLGVHELGHSITAHIFGCSHETSFGIGRAVTHVVCDSALGSTLIILAGFILTVKISFLMYFMGNNFAKRISYLLLGFSIITAFDDFSVLGVPYSAIIVLVFASAMLVGYGLVLVVNNYELEYKNYEESICAPACGKKERYLNSEQ